MSEEEKNERSYSAKIIVSFSLTSFAIILLQNILFIQLPIFYEVEIGLPVIFMLIAITIYTLWDAFNDLIAGSVTDRITRFTKRWGKRFPWIIISSIPICFALPFLFAPPDINIVGTIGIFFWFLIALLVFDGLNSFWTVSYYALASDKFRSDKNRTSVATYSAVFATLGGAIAALVLPMFIVFGNPSSYLTGTIIFSVIALIFILLSIPGVRESRKMIDRALSTQKSQNEEPFVKDFFKSMKIGFKSKNFIGYIAFSIGNAIFVALFLPSMLFYVKYVLKMEAGIASFIAIPYVLAGLLPLPLFFWLTNKYGHLKLFKIGILLMPLSLVPLLFASDLMFVLVTAIFIGMFPSLIGVAGGAIRGDFIDEGSIAKGKRVDGTYNAIVVFITRVGTIIQYLTIFLIHDVFTDFDPGAIDQSLIAIWGLRVQIALVPIVALYLGAFVFIKLWNITKEKSDLQKKKLMELNF